MNDQKIYQKIGELLWSIMPKEAKMIFCEGYIYPDINSCGFEWLTQNGKQDSFDFDKVPVEIGAKLDRVGEPTGSFLAPAGTPYEARALAPGSASAKVYLHMVVWYKV